MAVCERCAGIDVLRVFADSILREEVRRLQALLGAVYDDKIKLQSRLDAAETRSQHLFGRSIF